MKTIWIACLIIFFNPVAMGENLGAVGEPYALDKDAREQMKDVVRRKQASGELDAYWKNYRDKTIDAIKHPAPLSVSSNYDPRAELHDLTFTIPQDYVNEKGQVVARKGAAIKPLRIQPLKSGLIFIDGRDQKQIDYAIKLGKKHAFKIVLTAGSPFDLRVKYQNTSWRFGTGVPFYFDQRKMIIDNFRRLYGVNINSVPAVLYQKDEKLAVEFGMK